MSDHSTRLRNDLHSLSKRSADRSECQASIEEPHQTEIAVKQIIQNEPENGLLLSDLHEATTVVLAILCPLLAPSSSNLSVTCSGVRKSPTDVLTLYVLWGDLLGKVESVSSSFPNLHRNVARLLLRSSKNVLKLARQEQLDVNLPALFTLETWVDKASFVLDKNVSTKDISKNQVEQEDTEGSDASSLLTLSVGDETEGAFEALNDDISLLMELAPSISSLATFNRPCEERVSSAQAPFEISQPAREWILRIADKYVDAPQSLVNRLGEANWQRFCKLRLERDTEIATEYGGAKSLFHDASTYFHDSALGSSLASGADDKRSVASHSSFASNAANDSHHFNRVPPDPPEIAAGLPFVCGACNVLVQDIRNRTDWK